MHTSGELEQSGIAVDSSKWMAKTRFDKIYHTSKERKCITVEYEFCQIWKGM